MTVVSSHGTLDPPGGRMKTEEGWRWKEAGGLVKTPNWQGRWVEPAGAWLPDCTCYPTNMMGTLASHLFEKERNRLKKLLEGLLTINSNSFKRLQKT